MARVVPRLISLTVEGVDRSNEIGKFEITSNPAEAEFQSFLEARQGGARDYAAVLTITQDHASGTLWDLIWTGAGTEVDGIYAPYGNLVPSATQPHYTFTAVVKEPDGRFFGSEVSNAARAAATVEVTWPLTGKPVKDTTP